jgi:flagellar protein FlaG
MEIQRVNSNQILGSLTEGGASAAPVERETLKRAVVALDKSTELTPNAKNLQETVDKINSVLRMTDSDLEFSIDRDTKLRVVKMTDVETGEVIMQYPSEVMLAIAKAIDEGMKQGVLLNQKA